MNARVKLTNVDRIFYCIDMFLYFCRRCVTAICNYWSDLLIFIMPTESWEAFNYFCYRRQNYYGEKSQKNGYTTWEADAIHKYFPAAPASVLVIAAGGGREVVELQKKGYQVSASEFIDTFNAALVKVMQDTPQLVYSFSFQDLICNSKLLENQNYDAIILSFGAISHVATRSDQVLLLKKLGELCSQGPILLSWLKYRPYSIGRRKWRAFLRKILGRSGSKFKSYSARHGPIHTASKERMSSIIAEANLKIAHIEDVKTYPHAVCYLRT